jgi:peptidoglycan/LPS O-acetylase OafA/YrhL
MAFHLNRTHLYGGYLGVDVFFVLSGLLITTVLLRERDRRDTISFSNFYVRRALRLFPALGAVVIFSVIAAVAMPSQAWATPTLHALPAVVFYFSNWARVANHNFGGLFGHTWSLAIEEQFYLVWPLVMLFLLRRQLSRRQIAAGLLLAAVIDMLYRQVGISAGLNLYRVDSGIDTYCDGLLLGCALAVYLSDSDRPALAAGVRRVVSVLAWGALGALIVDILVGNTGISGREVTFPLAPICAAVILLGVSEAPRSKLAQALSLRPAVWIGERSYGLYLWHLPIYLIIADLGWSRGRIDLTRVALSFVAAALSYRFIEQPFLRLKTRFSNAQGAAAAAATVSPRGQRAATPRPT